MKSCFTLLLLCGAINVHADYSSVVNTGLPLQNTQSTSITPSVSTLNEMMNRMTQMQKEIQQLTGKVEDQVFIIAELKKQQKTMYTDFDERLAVLEAKANGTAVPTASTPVESSAPVTEDAVKPVEEAAPSEAVTSTEPTTDADVTLPAVSDSTMHSRETTDTPKTENEITSVPSSESSRATPASAEIEAKAKIPTPTEASPPVSEDEKQDYQQAYNQLRTGHTPEAIAAFDAYLVKYPSSSYASNVQYWLGEAYRVNQDNDAAKTAFNKVIDTYPSSPKIPDALLKLGYIEVDLNNNAKATEYLTRITREFPNSNAAYLASKKLAGLVEKP